MKRALSPSTNPAGLLSAAGAVYAAVVMILNAVHGHGVIDPKVIVAAAGAAGALYARFLVTPVKDPKDGNGQPLLHIADVAAAVAQKPPPDAVVTPSRAAADEKLAKGS